MKVVFLQDLKDQKVKKDDIREVADGFARNFLFPKKLAAPATSAALQQLHFHALKHESEKQKGATQRKVLQEKLRSMTLSFTERAHEGKLYGGISAERIASELAKYGIAVDATHVRLEHPIKMVGEHRVTVKLAEGVEGSIMVHIVAECETSKP